MFSRLQLYFIVPKNLYLWSFEVAVAFFFLQLLHWEFGEH